MASISGPSSITINSLPATWTASGFSNPDIIDWDYTGSGSGSGSGNTFTITKISNSNATFKITATDGTTSASKTVTVTKVDIPVTSFSPSSSSVSVYDGSSTTVSYKYSPSNATSGTLPSLSSGGKYCSASVSSGSIRITGTSVGSETLTFSNSNGVSFSISVTVKSSGSSTTTVTSMSISSSSLTIQEGKTGRFTVTVSPSTANDLTIGITCSDSNYDSYLSWSTSRSGATTTVTVRGLSYSSGRVRLAIRANGGSISVQYVDVYVTKAPVYVSDFDLPASPKYITSSSNLSFKVTALPSNADDKSWSYSVISGSEYATINRLSSPANTISISPKSEGTIRFRFTADDAGGYSETFTVIISDTISVSDIYVNYQGEVGEEYNIVTMDVPEGKYKDIWSNVRPTNATNPALTITNLGGTGEATMETIGGSGTLLKHRVTGVKMGTTRFRLSTNDGSGVSYTFTVNITEKINDDFPHDYEQFTIIHPYVDVDYITLRNNNISIVDSTYKVHAGYVTSPINLRGLYIPAGGLNFTSVPSYEDPLSLTTGIALQGMHDGQAREFWIYVTNENGLTLGNRIIVEREGDYVKTLRFNKNPPSGKTVTGTLPTSIVYDGTGDSREYIFTIPESDLKVTGYVFVGWREYKDNTPCNVYTANEKFKMKGGNMDITLYAEWFPIPEGATGTGTVDDPFTWTIDLNETAKLDYTIPNVGDYPITYRATFPDWVPDGMIFNVNGTETTSFNRISLTGGVLKITGEPKSSMIDFVFTQTGQRAYQRDFNVTVVTKGETPPGTDEPDQPTGKKAVVAFNPDGGTSSVKTITTNVGSTIVLPDADYTGKMLIGWYTPAGDFAGGSGDRYLVPSSITLTANWGLPTEQSANCYLSASYNGITKTMYFDLVNSIDDTITSNLSSYSTLVFGAANRYIIDLGNSRRFSIGVVRDNPANYNDALDDQRKWSNGKWLREFLNLIDFWQNFGRDPKTGKNTGGMRFHFEPPASAVKLYPTIDKIVFVSGTVTPSYAGPQKIQMTIPLQVASMAVSSAGDPSETVTYKSNKTGMDSFTQSFVKGATVTIPSTPVDWLDMFDGSILTSWTGSDGKTYYPNESAKLKTGMTMTANWKNCWYRGSIEDSYWEVIADGRLMIYAVGGGGAGASCKAGLLTGGGGGAGRTRILTISVRKGDLVEWDLGAGGEPLKMEGGTSNGGDGGETVVTLNGLEILRAEGGKGGMEPKSNGSAGGPFTGYGGQGWGSGGTSNIPRWMKDGEYLLGVTKDVKGGDGSTVAPNIEANVGKGYYGGDTKNELGYDTAWMGGSGGGASGLYVRFGSTVYMSKGGDGGYISGDSISEFTPPGDGKYGGGGGSGVGTEGGSGGKGFVILAFYST